MINNDVEKILDIQLLNVSCVCVISLLEVRKYSGGNGLQKVMK